DCLGKPVVIWASKKLSAPTIRAWPWASEFVFCASAQVNPVGFGRRVAFSISSPATIDDEGLVDAGAANRSSARHTVPQCVLSLQAGVYVVTMSRSEERRVGKE